MALGDMALNSDHPQGATPLDPDELAGLKFAHVPHLSNIPATSQPHLPTLSPQSFPFLIYPQELLMEIHNMTIRVNFLDKLSL